MQIASTGRRNESGYVTSCFVRFYTRAIFVWPWKMVSVSVGYLFYQPIHEKIKIWTLFPPKKTLIWRMHCSIGQSCCRMTSKRGIDWFLSKATRVCIRSTNQSNHSISVRLLFLYSSYSLKNGAKLVEAFKSVLLVLALSNHKYTETIQWAN